MCTWVGSHGSPEKRQLIIIIIFSKIMYLELSGVSVAACGLSLLQRVGAALPCGAQAASCGGFSCCKAWAPGRGGSVVAAHAIGCPAACGVFLCPLNWQVDS